jgi:proteic killer suppression protein
VLRPIFAGLIGPGVLLNRALRGCSNRGPTKPPTIRPLVAISASPSLSPSQWPRRTQTNLPPANPVRFKRPCAADLHHRILVRLDAIDKAASLAALSQPGFDFHPLRRPVPRRYSIHVNGPWCITFEWREGRALRVDLEQYIDDEENMPAETLPATAPKHREYRARRPLQRGAGASRRADARDPRRAREDDDHRGCPSDEDIAACPLRCAEWYRRSDRRDGAAVCLPNGRSARTFPNGRSARTFISTCKRVTISNWQTSALQDELADIEAGRPQ